MIDRCICFSKTFAELKALAERHGARCVPSLQRAVPFGSRCGLCKPYVQRMLETGRTAFPAVVMPMHPFEEGEWEDR